jgi:hypothetical protein
MIGPDASAVGFDEKDLFEQLLQPLLRLCRDLGELRRAAPLLRLQALGCEVAAHTVGVGIRQIDLVHRDDDRHFGRLRV